MNGKDLMVGMSFVDEKFIQEAETKQIKNQAVLRKQIYRCRCLFCIIDWNNNRNSRFERDCTANLFERDCTASHTVSWAD